MWISQHRRPLGAYALDNKKNLTGSQLTATAVYKGKSLSGQLRPHSIDRTQVELTRSCLVDLLTVEGTFTFNCKHLISITTL